MPSAIGQPLLRVLLQEDTVNAKRQITIKARNNFFINNCLNSSYFAKLEFRF
jgi:hypothetical protein